MIERDSAGRFIKGSHWRPHQRFRDRDFLIEEYIVKQHSASEIASAVGVTEAGVLYWLKKHKIPRRNVSQAREIKHWGLSGKDNPMYGKYGEESPNYIDGSSPERQSLYSRGEWKELVKDIYARDNYTCQRCRAGKTPENKLNAHHIKPWAGHPELRSEPSNIITLCVRCHRWIHSKENTNNEYLST